MLEDFRDLKEETHKENSAAAAAAKLLQLCPTLCNAIWQPTRLPRPWDSPGKNAAVGCLYLDKLSFKCLE